MARRAKKADETDLFLALTPERVLDAVEAAGVAVRPLCYPLNSFENRVYEVELEDRTRIIAKFYRPGRWTRDQILEEHRFLAELADAEIPVCPTRPFPDGETLKHTDPKARSIQEYRDTAGVDEGMTGISTRFAFKVLSETFNHDTEEVAADLAAIIEHYAGLWSRPEVLLIGYSFGADILPFAYNRLQAPARAKVKQLSLLALSTFADFEIHLSGWLGDSRRPDSLDTAPELARLGGVAVQCFYGIDDTGTGCTLPELMGAEIVRTTGGHHFDGNYPALAKQILAGTH